MVVVVVVVMAVVVEGSAGEEEERRETGIIVAGWGASIAKAAFARSKTRGKRDNSPVLSLRCKGSERGGRVVVVVVVEGSCEPGTIVAGWWRWCWWWSPRREKKRSNARPASSCRQGYLHRESCPCAEAKPGGNAIIPPD